MKTITVSQFIYLYFLKKSMLPLLENNKLQNHNVKSIIKLLMLRYKIVSILEEIKKDVNKIEADYNKYSKRNNIKS